MNVLVGLHGRLPESGRAVAGVALRARAIAEGLRAHGHKVCFVTRARDYDRPGVGSLEGESGDEIHVYESGHDLSQIVSRLSPDVFIACQPEMLGLLDPAVAVPTVADLYAPRPLEFAFQEADQALELIKFLEYVGRADAFICTSERQRTYYLSWLMLAGVDTRHPPIAVVPLSAPDTTLAPVRNTVVGVAGGVFWPWQDQMPVVQGALAAMDEAGQGELHLYGGAYLLSEKPGQFDSPWKALAHHSRVSTPGFGPYDELLAAYTQAGFALSAMRRNTERELAVSFRDMDYLGAGLPLVVAHHATLAPLVAAYGAGWVLDDTERPEAATRLVRSILADPAEVMRRSANARKLAAERFVPRRTVEALLPFVSEPAKRERTPSLWGEIVRFAHDNYLDRARRVAELEEVMAVKLQLEETKTRYASSVRDYEAALRDVDRAGKAEVERMRERNYALELELSAAHRKHTQDTTDITVRHAQELSEVERRRVIEVEGLREALRAREAELSGIKGSVGYQVYQRIKQGSGRLRG